MKKKNKGRKSLTAVGAVVAAGLTPGIATGTPAPPAPVPEVELTAADAVAINGDVFDFDELFAMRQINRDQRDISKLYGPPPSVREKEREEAIREQMRQDSIRRVREEHALVYGPPPGFNRAKGPEYYREMATDDKEAALDFIQNELKSVIADLTSIDRSDIMPESDFSSDLNINSAVIKALSGEIENRYGVVITDEMLPQLNTLRRLSKFIIEVIEPIKD